jgi:hypothetical protein
VRAAAAAVAALAGLLVPAGAAAPPKPIRPIPILPVGTATASAVPATAGARPAALTVTLRLELRCGRLGPGPIVVVLPAAVRVPPALSRADVHVNGGPPASVSLSRHVIGLTVPRVSGITCDVMAPGRLTVAFLSTAGLGNPATPGRYAVSIRAGGSAAVAHLVIS